MSRHRLGLTRRGWTAAGAAAGLLLGGRLLGADELTVLGVAIVAVLVGATVWAGIARPGISVARAVEPPRLHVDDPARVRLVVRAARATPLQDLTEPIDEGRLRARFLLAPLRAREVVEPAYRLPTDRRGRLTIGPAQVTRTDPLGLARRPRVVAPAETILVRPRVFAIASPAIGVGSQFAAEDTESPRAPSADAGGEFLAVRPYEVGDDPRRVHWRSSARTGELMVRQFVAPRRGRTLVVLDTRAPTEPSSATPATTAAFERAVEAAASIIAALVRARRPVECITSAGTFVARPGTDPQRAFDHLATVMMDEPDMLDAVARSRRRRPPELLVLVTAQHDGRIRAARRILAPRTASLLVVTGGTPPDARRGLVVDARTVPFPDAWRANASRRPRPRAVGADPAPTWISGTRSPRPSRSRH